jgi:hypothetical protein
MTFLLRFHGNNGHRRKMPLIVPKHTTHLKYPPLRRGANSYTGASSMCHGPHANVGFSRARLLVRPRLRISADPVMQNRRWLRAPGDTTFFLGAVALVIFVAGLVTGRSFQRTAAQPAT